MLTGKLPRGQFKSPSQISPEIDPRLDQIVSKALQTDPDDRYPNAAAVRADLNRILSHPMAHIKAGEDSGHVPAAVPLTPTIAKRPAGGNPHLHFSKAAAVTPRPQPVVPASTARVTSKAPFYAIAGIAGILLVAWAAVSLFGTKENKPQPINPATSQGQSTGDNPSSPKPEQPAPETAAPVDIAKTDPAAPPKNPEPETGTTPRAPEKPVTEPKPPEIVATKPEMTTPATVDPSQTTAAEKTAMLAGIPGLTTRLEAYIAARRTQLGDRATKYLRGIVTRINQAAAAGDLKLTTAFGEEKALVETLVKTLTAPPGDPLAAVTGETIVLPELPSGSPEVLVTLRQTWTTEADKIRASLDSALQQSLQALEIELTKARDLENAKAVLAYRGSLVAGGAAVTVNVPSTIPAPVSSAMSPATATKDKPFENTLGMKFVPVPKTDVLFCIHEVRYKDYAAYAKENARIDAGWKNQIHHGFTIKDNAEEHPVVYVCWDDANAFCAWLSKTEGKTYRLPIDHEWSIAVGIGDDEDEKATPEGKNSKIGNVYPWGKEWPPPKGVGNYSDLTRKENSPVPNAVYIEGYRDDFPTTAPVMSFEPNRLGLYDLGGNVWEWCGDWFDPVKKQRRVLRGGSWGSGTEFNLRSSCRYYVHPMFRRVDYGFRCVLVVAGG